MPAKKKKKKKRFSFSLLSLNCPRRIIKTLNQDAIEILPADVTDIGRVVHSYLDEILSKPREKWDFTPLTTFTKIYGNPKKCFSRIEGKFETEKKIRIRVAGHIFTTLSDLLVTRKGERDIVDHKTTFTNEVIPPYREQLQYYSLPFLREGLRVKVGIHFVRFARIEWIQILEGLDDYTRIVTQVTSKIKRTEAIIKKYRKVKEVDTQPSNFECKYCPFIISCPLRPDCLVTNDQKAGELAGEYIKLTTKVKKIEEVLRIWAAYVGNIYLPDAMLGFNSQGKTIIDEEAILEYLKKHKIPIIEVFTASATKFKKLARKCPEIANFSEIEYRPRWGVKKVTDREKEEVTRFVLVDPDVHKQQTDKAIAKIEEISRTIEED